jgi:hypothetical protein
LFCASSEEEDFGRATKEEGVGVAATMAGFGRTATSRMMALEAEEDAATKAELFCASSEEKGFGRASKEEMEVDATTMAGFEEAAVSSKRASTGLEVATVMAGLVGAAAAMADSRRCCDCRGGCSVKRSR